MAGLKLLKRVQETFAVDETAQMQGESKNMKSETMKALVRPENIKCVCVCVCVSFKKVLNV